MIQKRKLVEIIDEIKENLVQRGQSQNAVSNYHYIYQVFLQYSKTYHEEYYSKEILECCLREHYGITDEKILSRRQHYKKKVLRAFRILCDCAEGRPFADRYTDSDPLLQTQTFIDAVIALCDSYEKNGHRPQTVECYRRYAERFLGFAEQNGVFSLHEISVELINSFTLTLAELSKWAVKSILGSLRIFLRFLYLNEYMEHDFSQSVVGIQVRTQTKIPSVWAKEEVLQLLTAIDRGNPSGKRDYAILLLVTRLGIRVGDITNLKFEKY